MYLDVFFQKLYRDQNLTLIREFFGPSPSAISEKKIQKIACDVTVGTIQNGICQYERRYATLNKNICHFWDRHRARLPETNSKAREHIKMMQRCALEFFLQNTLGDGPAFWIFFGIHG